MVEQAGAQHDDGCRGRPRHRCLVADQVGIGDQQHDDPAGQPAGAYTGRPAEQQQTPREDHDVAARDGNDVIRPALLQPARGLFVETGAVADEHGGDALRHSKSYLSCK